MRLNCPKCGASNADDAAFCASCGAALPSPSTAAPAAPSTAPAPSASQSTTGQKGSVSNRVMDVLNDAIALVQNPVAYLEKNKDRTVELNSLMTGYVAILALVPLVGRLLGDLIFLRAGLGYAIGGSILAYILDLVSVYVIGFVIWKLAPRFKSEAGQAKATLMAAYLYTPIFLIGILNIVPILGYLAILGLLYGLYILYLGLPIVLKTPKDQTVTYLFAIVVVSFIILIVISVIIDGFDGLALR